MRRRNKKIAGDAKIFSSDWIQPNCRSCVSLIMKQKIMKWKSKEDLIMKQVLSGVSAVLFVFVLTAMAAMAEPGCRCKGNESCGGCGAGGMYDPAKTEVLTGQVVSMEQSESRRGPGKGVILKVSVGSETLSVHLGPQWYLDQQTVKIALGDTVEIKGSKTVRGEESVFIAAEAKKGSEVLKLRDENGAPAWTGPRGGECKHGV